MLRSFRRKQILSLVQPFVGTKTKVLDAGCGDAWLLHSLKAKRKVGLDTQRHQRLSMQGIEFFQASVYSLPFPSASFDVVVLNSMVEHLKDANKALRECRRTLKKGGKILVWMPTAQSDWLLKLLSSLGLLGRFRHERYYGLEEFAAMLERAGFRVLRKEFKNFSINEFFVGEKK